MFNEAVITMDGLELDAKIRAGQTVATFTHVKLGDGIYTGTEDLSVVTDMKSVRQTFGISSILVTDNKTVRLRTVSDNVGIDEGYLISEIGIFAQDPDKGEILYSIALGVDSKMDYQPSESELPGATSTFDTYVSVSNVEAATIITGCGAAASAEDVEEIKYPQFDDSGEVEGITSFPTFLEKVKSKMNFFDFFKNFKAGFKFVLHAGQIVNNCVSDNAELPLSAMQGKVLMDLINQTNGNLSHVLTQDILSYALSSDCKIGFSSGLFAGNSYIGDLPADGMIYGTWEITKRSQNTITVKAFSPYESTMWINSYDDTNGWHGWKKMVSNNDLETLDRIYAPIFDGTSYSTTDLAVQAYIDSLPNDSAHVHFGIVSKNARTVVIAQKYDNSNYASAIAFSYHLPTLKFYRKLDGSWQPIKEI